jgi:predicted  nucleic acid-binding Zn-ribbon protein
VTTLEPLLTLQERDVALDRLRHRRDTLPELAAHADAQAQAATVERELAQVRAARDEVLTNERRLDDEAQKFSGQATDAERRLYSGEIASPRELQALQADVESLRRHQREIEDRAIATMETREPLDQQVSTLEQQLQVATGAVAAAGEALATAQATIDAEVAVERAAREEVVAGIDSGLVADYELRRVKANGVGAARLVGNTCQGCHLTIPATEVDRIRHAPAGSIAYCDNCGCILIP